MQKPHSKLRGKIVEVYGSIRDFSKDTNVSEQTIIAKLNGRVPFKQPEIILWCNLLGVEKDQIGEFFFSEDTFKTVNNGCVE